MSETETATDPGTPPAVDRIDVFTVGTDIPEAGGVLWVTEIGPDGEGRVFDGTWVDPSDVNPRHDGDVFVRLTPVEGGRLVDVELVIVHANQIRPGGAWAGLDAGWPQVLFGPTQTLMGIHIDLEASGHTCMCAPVTV